MKTAKARIKRLVASRAGWRLVRPLRPDGCLVLAYHRIVRDGDPFPGVRLDDFRAQMRWVRANCRPTSQAGIIDGSAFQRSDRPCVLVTFDDGYLDYVSNAYPVLRELEIPALNFLSTQAVDDGTPFWWDVLEVSVRVSPLRAATAPWPGGQLFQLDPAGRRAFLRSCKGRLKAVSENEKSHELARIQAALHVDSAAVECGRQVLTWADARATLDITTYGGHTHTHVLVSRVDRDRLEREIETCAARIAAEIGQRPLTFAYPNGDVTDDAPTILRAAGFRAAFTMMEGFNTRATDSLLLRRVAGPRTVEELAWVVGGLARFADGGRT